MSTQLKAPPAEHASAEPPTAGDMEDLRQEIRRQGRGIRSTQRAFTIFAAMALILSLVTFLAVAIKLDKKTSPAVAPSAGTKSAPAAPAALARSSRAVLKEFSIAPTPDKVAAGKVSFSVANAGKIEHEFVVLRTNKRAGDLLKGKEADETGNVGEIGSVLPGQTKKLTLNLKAGHYALICNLPGHYTAGQHADFNVVNVK
jgi:uncharacterized cupredoxin-like copper-binding protein